jgi:hypothetical protein
VGRGSRQEGFRNDRNRRHRYLGGEITVRKAVFSVLRWRLVVVARVLDNCCMVRVAVIMRVLFCFGVIVGNPMMVDAERPVKRHVYDRKQLESAEPERTRQQGAPPGFDLSDAPGTHRGGKLSRFGAAINREITHLQ